MDQRRWLQPEPTALFLYKHKTKDEKWACWGRATKLEGPGAVKACGLSFSGRGPGEPGQIFPSSNREAEAGPVPSVGQPREEAGGPQAVLALGEPPAAETAG